MWGKKNQAVLSVNRVRTILVLSSTLFDGAHVFDDKGVAERKKSAFKQSSANNFCK